MLMRLLIDTLDAESEEGAEDAWRAEVERRIAEKLREPHRGHRARSMRSSHSGSVKTTTAWTNVFLSSGCHWSPSHRGMDHPRGDEPKTRRPR